MDDIEKTIIDVTSLNELEAENIAVQQFIKIYNETDEKNLDIPKLELVLRIMFHAGIYYKEAVMNQKIKKISKNCVNAIEQLRDFSNEIHSDTENSLDFFDKIMVKADELASKFN